MAAEAAEDLHPREWAMLQTALSNAPSVGLDLAGFAPQQQVAGGGITTFMGLLTAWDC